MPNNLFKRVVTSFFLISVFLIVNFSYDYVFILSISILGMIIFFEAKNLFSKIIFLNSSKNYKNKINIKFLTLNIVTFCYVFFIFCIYSFKIHNLINPIFFLYVVSICVFTDIGGYTFGKIIGGKKLTKISPNKTISGSLGSFVFSLFPLLASLKIDYLNLEFSLNNIIFCLIVSFTSQLGDLFVSYLKRKAKVKDTGKILPGHGGALDRVDGIIFAIPCSYFLLKFL